jgi:arylsulfatase A-like enzyme
VAGDYKLLEDPGPEYKLFNLAKDPGELLDLAPNPKHKAELERMRKLFDEAWAPHKYVAPFGGRKLTAGLVADGPRGPKGWKDPDEAGEQK